MQPAPRPSSTTHNRPHAEKVAVLWQCPHCNGWNVTAHTIAAIQRAWVAGSRASPLRAPCRVGGEGINGLPPCVPSEATTGYRTRNRGSRGGLTTVRLVGRWSGLPEAAVSLTRRRQVERLRNVASAATHAAVLATMTHDDGEGNQVPFEPQTMADRWADWWREGGEHGNTNRPQPWRRWESIVDEAEAPVLAQFDSEVSE